jgi:hypothetical protein
VILERIKAIGAVGAAFICIPVWAAFLMHMVDDWTHHREYFWIHVSRSAAVIAALILICNLPRLRQYRSAWMFYRALRESRNK